MADQETLDKARNVYGISNADKMSDKQLKAEMDAIDAQPKSDDHYVAPKKAAPRRAAAPKSEAKTSNKSSKK